MFGILFLRLGNIREVLFPALNTLPHLQADQREAC